MEHQKNSLPSNANSINFAANPFPSQFPGLNSVAGTTNHAVTSPLFMSSLQQFSTGAAAGFLPSTNQLGASWNAQCQQTASWIDQANKMAAMLPMYNALQTAVNASDPSYIQQNLKNQAAVVAAAAACMPMFASQSLSAVTEAGSSVSQTKTSGGREWNEVSPCSQSASTSSHPPSHEAIDSPINYSKVHEGNKSSGLASNIAATRLSNTSVEDLSTLELHDFGDYLIGRTKEVGNPFPASLFGVEETFLPSSSKSMPTSIEQRSSSCETKPSSSSMRSHESIHDEQQAEELANADFELDRLVSLVAKHDANIIAPLPSSSLFSLDAFKTTEKSGGHLDLLNPPQFTPPDSPTNQDAEQKPTPAILSLSSQAFAFSSPNHSDAKTCSSIHSSSTSLQSKPDTPSIQSPGLPLMFMPKVSPNKSPAKSAVGGGVTRMRGSVSTTLSTRVPIYKSGKSSSFAMKELAGPSTSFLHDKSDDAFSFTDEEEPEPSLVPQSSKHPTPLKAGIQSVYMPPTANSSENESDLLKHVVPKKRHLVQKNVMEEIDPATLIHPSSTTLADDGVLPQTSLTSSTLAQLIRSRRSKRTSTFLKCEFVEGNDCVCLNEELEHKLLPLDSVPLATCSIKLEEPDEQSDVVKSKESPRPLLPKLVIKLLTTKKEPGQNNENEFTEISKKKRKKRKKKEKDKDWLMAGHESSKKEKHHHHKKKKHKKHKKENRKMYLDSDGDSENSSKRSSHVNDCWDSTSYSKKSRLINNQWSRSEETQLETSSTADGNFVSVRPKARCDIGFVSERLKFFSKADGRSLPKGTFLVVKEEAFKPDCPLWKVDNQNLLQKYLPLSLTQTACEDSPQEIRRYKNSSTYAGWCEQIADDYLIVEIRYVKHSRSENIIEPIIPIADLIPAVSCEIAGQSAVRTEEEIRREKTVANEDARLGDGGLKTHLHTFLQALLNHAVSLTFLQTVKSTNDWNFLCALDEFDQQNLKACKKISTKVKWLEEFEAALHTYSDLSTVCGDFTGAETCQACANSDASASAQLFSNETYNRETLLMDVTNFDCDDLTDNSFLPAVEFMVCSACQLAAKVYHGIYHMKYHIFKRAEEKLESVGEENPELTSEAAVELCLSNKSWIQNSLNDYQDLCRKATESFS